MAEPQSEMRLRLSKYASALSSFSHSPDNIRVLTSIPEHSAASPRPPSTLYVLDSSFNPPTRAHLRIATSALIQDHGSPPKRLLLLLATQNADKAPKPAPFEHRLALMSIFAEDLRTAIKAAFKDLTQPTVDIGVTKLPYFTDKAKAITESGLYPPTTTQVHLTGFDTLIRIFDPKYYPPTHTLAPLEPFLSHHRLRVTYRTGAEWGDRVIQDSYLTALAEGKREAEGGKREWADRVQLVEGRVDGEEVISSTRVREAAKSGDRETLRKLVTDGVADWVLQEKLYLEQ